MQRLHRFVRSLLLITLLPAPGFVGAQSEPPSPTISYQSTIDWERGRIGTRATVDLLSIEAGLPAARRSATVAAGRAIVPHIVATVAELPVGSTTTIGDIARLDPVVFAGISEFAESGRMVSSVVDRDLSELYVDFEFSIYPDLVSLFIDHTRSVSQPPFLGYYPTTPYTGIVIYALDPLPVHGENGTTDLLVPALRPRIYDTDLELVYETSYADPDLATAGGVVGYTDSLDLSRFHDRIGQVPLVTAARALFGETRTDVIIPRSIAQRIRASETNRRLLTEARILIILPLP